MATELAGSLLVRAGLVKQAALDAAHARRKASGANLIEELVLGGLPEKQLCDFFGQKLLVPQVGHSELQRIPARVINLLPRELAAEFFAVPVSMDGEQNLLVAMADPGDTRAVDEIAFFTGAYVMRAVAPASTLAWALYHYYQIESRLLPAIVGKRTSRESQAMTPESPTLVSDEPTRGAPPPAARGKKTTPPPLRKKATTPPPVPAEPEPVIILDAKRKKSAAQAVQPEPKVLVAPELPVATEAPLVPARSEVELARGKRRRALVVPDVFGEETPLPAPMPLGATGPVAVLVPPEASGKRKKRTTLTGIGSLGQSDGKRPSRPITAITADKLVADCRDALDDAVDRDAVVDALVGLLAGLYRRAAFFALRRDQLTGWRAAGHGPDAVAFRHLVIDLRKVPTLQDAIETRLPRLGPPDEATQKALSGPLGGPLNDSLVLPLALRERAVGVAIADGAVLSFSPAHLVDIGHAAARALERVISSKKTGG